MFVNPMNMLRIGLSSRVCNENLVIIEVTSLLNT